MARRVKAVSGMLYALGGAAALMFGAQQVWAASADPCVCPVPFETGFCSDSGCCTGGSGMCSSQFYCICG